MTERPRALARRYLRETGIAAIIATIPGLAFAIAIVKHQRGTFGEAFLHEGLFWYGWALVTPAILWAARRFPIDRSPRRGAIVTHLAFALVCGGLQAIVILITHTLLGQPSYWGTEEFIAGRAVGMAMSFGVVIYGVIATIGFALDYHAKMRDRERTATRLEALLTESRLGALRMQLQPHFLFNALNTVAMLVRQGDSQTSVRVLARLSELMRQVLDDEAPQEVPLTDELEFVTRYLDIERVRFGERLHVNIEADDDALVTSVPHLMLQPLVENAVRHGIARSTGARRIDVTARQRNCTLHVAVRDDGPGLPPDWSLASARGIGLRNTRKRLQYLYGDAASLEISNARNGGTEVNVMLPVRTAVVDA